MKVAIYSDIVCPWCYVGEHRFRQAVESSGVTVEVTFRRAGHDDVTRRVGDDDVAVKLAPRPRPRSEPDGGLPF